MPCHGPVLLLVGVSSAGSVTFSSYCSSMHSHQAWGMIKLKRRVTATTGPYNHLQFHMPYSHTMHTSCCSAQCGHATYFTCLHARTPPDAVQPSVAILSHALHTCNPQPIVALLSFASHTCNPQLSVAIL